MLVIGSETIREQTGCSLASEIGCVYEILTGVYAEGSKGQARSLDVSAGSVYWFMYY